MADKSLYDVCEQLRANSDENTRQLSTLNSSVIQLNNMMKGFLDMMAQNRLDMLEMLREQKSETEAAATGGAAKDDGKGLGLAGILAGIAAVLGGIFLGLLDSIKALAKLARLDKLLDLAKTRFGNLANTLIKVIDDLIKPIKTFFSADGGFGRFVKGIRGAFRQTFTGALNILDDLIQPFKTLLSGEGVVGQRISRLFNGIIDIFKFPFEPILDDFGKGIRGVFGAGEDGVGFFRRILNGVKAIFDPLVDAVNKTLDLIKGAFSIFSEGSDLMRLLGNIGRVIGRLFLPFTLIMTAYDTVKGAIAGFEEDGFLGGLQGAVTGFLNSVFGAPIDLLLKGVKIVLDTLGFSSAAKALEDFSAQDLIADLIDGLFDMFKSVINGFLEVVAQGLDFVGMGDKVREYKLGTNTKELKENQEAIDEAEGKKKFLDRKEKQAERAFDSTYRAAMRDGEISDYEQRSLDKRRANLERAQQQSEENTAELERLRAERQVLQDGGSVTNIDQSQNSSNSTGLVTGPTDTHDRTDPNLQATGFSQFSP